MPRNIVPHIAELVLAKISGFCRVHVMAASLKQTSFVVFSSILKHHTSLQRTIPVSVRWLQTTPSCCKSVAARVKVSKGEKPITYEQANPPFQIGVRKSWNTQDTVNLDSELGSAVHSTDDLFIRKFIYGTFHSCLATDLIIKRRANQIILVAIMVRNMAPQKYYFLIGYTEELLSHWLKCPVKMEVQIVDNKPIYKWI